MYDKLEEQLVQMEERRRTEQQRLQSEQQRQAIQFQRAGFVQRGPSGSQQQKRRKRPSGWQ